MIAARLRTRRCTATAHVLLLDTSQRCGEVLFTLPSSANFHSFHRLACRFYRPQKWWRKVRRQVNGTPVSSVRNGTGDQLLKETWKGRTASAERRVEDVKSEVPIRHPVQHMYTCTLKERMNRISSKSLVYMGLEKRFLSRRSRREIGNQVCCCRRWHNGSLSPVMVHFALFSGVGGFDLTSEGDEAGMIRDQKETQHARTSCERIMQQVGEEVIRYELISLHDQLRRTLGERRSPRRQSVSTETIFPP